MKNFWNALYAEALKIRKAKVIWIVAAAFTIAPLMAGFFMLVLQNPEVAKDSGLLGAKAQIAQEATWPSYLDLYGQIIAVGGILVFGFTTSWIFGREYADKTVVDLMALPYSRTVIPMAKFTAAFITNLGLTAYIVIIGFLIGGVIGLPQWSTAIVSKGLIKLGVVTMLAMAVSTPVAFFAALGGGYLAPLGFVFITLVLSQILAAFGLGEFFPWSIPALYSGVVEGQGALPWGSLLVTILTSLAGILATLYWWNFADQH